MEPCTPPSDSPTGGTHTRQAYFGQGSGWLNAFLYSRADLSEKRQGPCIVQEYDATCVIPPGWSAELDEHGNVVVTAFKA